MTVCQNKKRTNQRTYLQGSTSSEHQIYHCARTQKDSIIQPIPYLWLRGSFFKDNILGRIQCINLIHLYLCHESGARVTLDRISRSWPHTARTPPHSCPSLNVKLAVFCNYLIFYLCCRQSLQLPSPDSRPGTKICCTNACNKQFQKYSSQLLLLIMLYHTLINCQQQNITLVNIILLLTIKSAFQKSHKVYLIFLKLIPDLIPWSVSKEGIIERRSKSRGSLPEHSLGRHPQLQAGPVLGTGLLLLKLLIHLKHRLNLYAHLQLQKPEEEDKKPHCDEGAESQGDHSHHHHRTLGQGNIQWYNLKYKCGIVFTFQRFTIKLRPLLLFYGGSCFL